ncbi:formyltransferase family protein [Pseudomonadales bacterium]|nr:formyltransferase family protein [Pseudomonadales bacterium]
MKNVAFLGSKDIGLACLKRLYARQKELDLQIAYVLTNGKGKDIESFCKEHALVVVNSLNDLLLRPSFDIGISVQYHEILKKEHISKANELFINLHMAPLPEYRGCNQFSFAILNSDKIFGTTVHRLETGIDSGDIIMERRFQIPPNCWVNELHRLTFEESLILFEETLPLIFHGNYEFTPQSSLLGARSSEIHYRKEIEEIKRIDLSWDQDKIERHIRATLMPGFEPPHTIVGGRKILLTEESHNK